MIVLFLGFGGLLTVFAIAGGVRPGPRPTLLFATTAAGAIVLALAAVWGAFGRGRSMLGRSTWRLVALSLTIPAMLFAWKLGWSTRFELVEWWPGRPGLRCLGLSLAMGVTPLAAFAFSRRRSDPVHPEALGLALGVAAGACAWSLVDLWCPVAHPAHLLTGHVLPLVLLAAAGWALGRTVIAVRRR